MIGGTIGYNWQVGQIVVGAGDIDWSGVSGQHGCCAAVGMRNSGSPPGGLSTRHRFLPHITAGLAAGDIIDPAGFPRRPAMRADRRRWSRPESPM
jgi:hypothetical protein